MSINSPCSVAATPSFSFEHIKSLIDDLPELKPIPTGTPTRLEPSVIVDAVIFDIYGTLLVSATGDIDGFEVGGANLERAMDRCGLRFNSGNGHNNILSIYKPIIQEELLRIRSEGIPYPEIDIIAVWRRIIDMAADKRWLLNEPESINCAELAFVFEVLSNQVYPMPEMAAEIANLAAIGLTLGVISNAQFYTPVIMNYFLNGGEVVAGESIRHFQNDLTVYSYKNRRAKPDDSMFKQLAANLAEKYGVPPERTLYVGNDMFKDVYPASQVGFKTVLFAGDQRSLRLRADKPQVQGLAPDYIIDDLSQINTIIGLG